MLIHTIRHRFTFAAGLFFLIPAVGFVGGCGESEPPSASSGSAQETSGPHGDHAQDGHAHENHSHNAEGTAAQTLEPGDLDADAQTALDRIATAYLTVQRKLAEDEMEGIQAQFDELHDAAHDLMHSEAPGIEEQARAVAEPVHDEPADLEQAREIFKALSVAVIDLVEMAPPSGEATPALHRAHCPMAEADWLQSGKEIANPYMGQDMLRCGTIEQVVKPGEQS